MSDKESSETFHSEGSLVLDTSNEGRTKPFRLVSVLSIIWEHAWQQPQRTPKQFFLKPSCPIQEVYITRLLVNLLWFSRNYLNFAAVCIFAAMLFSPPHALIVIGSGAIHFAKRTAFGNQRKSSSSGKRFPRPKKLQKSLLVIALTALHGACSMIICWTNGIFVVLVLICAMAIPTIFHALFTPYTDEAFEEYCNLLHRAGFSPPAPRSPTFAFEAKDLDLTSDTKREVLENPSPNPSTLRQEHSAPALRPLFTGLRSQKHMSSDVPHANRVTHDANDSLDFSLGTESMRQRDEESEKEEAVEALHLPTPKVILTATYSGVSCA